MGMVISTHLPPPVMIESTELRRWVTHMLCWSWAMYFSAARLFGERPWQHEFGLEHGFGALHDAVEGCRHPRDRRVLDPALHIAHPPAGVALIPGAVEILSRCPELHNEIAGQILGLGLAPFLAPEADQGGFIAAHDDPGVRAADESIACSNERQSLQPPQSLSNYDLNI